MHTSEFRILGMDCAEEVKALRAVLEGRPGVQALAFDILNARMTVTHDPAMMPETQIRTAVARTGMQAEPWRQAFSREAQPRTWQRLSRPMLTVASGVALLAAFSVHAMSVGVAAALGAGAEGAPPIAAIVLYGAAILCGAWFVAPKALHAVRRFRADMNLLMMLAVAGAMFLGEWFEAATVAFLFALSLTLESWSVGRARHAVTALMAVAPPKARIFCPHDKREEMVDVERVALGTRVFVRPGEKIPLDGIVVSGASHVDEAPITGESMAVEKEENDAVFAGTINGDGALEIRTTRGASDTMLARIIRLVSEAQSRRSPSEQWVERFARVYTPAVIVIAFGVASIPPLVLQQPFALWFYQALVLLVIACPCALVISTPVSIVAALTSSARHGVLVKGGVAMEMPARLRAIAFDKTGTLTQGAPQLRGIVALDEMSEDEALTLAASLETSSEHPIGRALVRAARERGLPLVPSRDYQAARGKGASAVLDGQQYWIGSQRYVAERGFAHGEFEAALARMDLPHATMIALGNESRVLALFAVADALREESREVIASLHRLGLKSVMLTGDNRATAEAIAREAGVDDVRAELLPEDKLIAIESLLRDHGSVAMVGDGVNDAPALARASLGIAMGAAGTDAALETADIALMGDDLRRLPWLIEHSRDTMRIIRQNIAISIFVKAVFVLLAIGGMASLWAAIAADMGVSLLVVFNALRLLRSPG